MSIVGHCSHTTIEPFDGDSLRLRFRLARDRRYWYGRISKFSSLVIEKPRGSQGEVWRNGRRIEFRSEEVGHVLKCSGQLRAMGKVEKCFRLRRASDYRRGSRVNQRGGPSTFSTASPPNSNHYPGIRTPDQCLVSTP